MPQNLKFAKVIPLYKKGSKTNVGNYSCVLFLRLISMVVTRKVVYDQVYEYIQNKKVFYDLQSGLRTSNSAEAYLTH